MGLEFTNHEIVTCAEVGYLTNWATQVPLKFLFILWGKGQRERERENPKQVPHSLQRGIQGSISPLWDHDLSQNQKSMLNRLSHPGAPIDSVFKGWSGSEVESTELHGRLCKFWEGLVWPFVKVDSTWSGASVAFQSCCLLFNLPDWENCIQFHHSWSEEGNVLR